DPGGGLLGLPAGEHGPHPLVEGEHGAGGEDPDRGEQRPEVALLAVPERVPAVGGLQGAPVRGEQQHFGDRVAHRVRGLGEHRGGAGDQPRGEFEQPHPDVGAQREQDGDRALAPLCGSHRPVGPAAYLAAALRALLRPSGSHALPPSDRPPAHRARPAAGNGAPAPCRGPAPACRTPPPGGPPLSGLNEAVLHRGWGGTGRRSSPRRQPGGSGCGPGGAPGGAAGGPPGPPLCVEPPEAGPSAGPAPSAGPGGRTGRVKPMTAPPPSRLAANTVPPCERTISSTMDSPRPDPGRARAAGERKNRSKTWPSSASSMPGPRSRTSTRPPRMEISMGAVPSASNLAAFSTGLDSARSRAVGCPCTT